VRSPRHRRVVARVRRGELRFFPAAIAVSRGEWDLDKPYARDFDFIVAANVFICSSRPQQWLEIVLARCSCFLLLDLVRRKRSASVSSVQTWTACGMDRRRAPTIRRLLRPRAIDDRLLGWRTFYGGANEHDDSPQAVADLTSYFR
jgi:hypothetical protein